MKSLSFYIVVIILKNLNSTSADCCDSVIINCAANCMEFDKICANGGADCWINRKICANGDVVNGFYCGIGECNMFGCNCDGGCKSVLPISKFDILRLKGSNEYHFAALVVNLTHIVGYVDNIVRYDEITRYQSDFDNNRVIRLNRLFNIMKKVNNFPDYLPERKIIENIEKNIGKKQCGGYNQLPDAYLNSEVCVQKWLYGEEILYKKKH